MAAIVQSAFGFSQSLSLPSPVTVGNLLIVVEDDWKTTGSGPEAPHSGLVFAHLGGTNAWTALPGIVRTAAAGERSSVAAYGKVATASDQTARIGPSDVHMGIYEISGATVADIDILSADLPGASTILDMGSFGTAFAGSIALLVGAQFTSDLGGALMHWSYPGWTVDSYEDHPFFGNSRPYWMGHRAGAGAALQARIDSDVNFVWAGIALLIGNSSPLECGFSGTPRTGDAPLTVAFTDETTGTPDSWLWEFGDGGTSTLQNPSHDYLTAGTYDVSLTVGRSSDSSSCDLTIEAYITVGSAPEAWDVYDRADPNAIAPIAVLDNAYDRWFRVELNGTGSGGFKINRHAAEARNEVLQKGNIVKVRIPELGADYVAAIILETGDFNLLDPGETGKEELQFGGRGILAYLDRAVMWHQAFTTGLDITDTWTEVWTSTKVSKPSGAAFDAAEPGYVYVAHLTTRKVAKVRQSDGVVVAWSPALWSDSTHYLAGISFDPSDSTIMWALEAPWLSGSGDNTRVRKIRRSDWATLVNTSLLSAIQHTDIRADASNLWLSRYDGSTTIYQRSKTNPATVVNSYPISYKGVVQKHANGIAINGTRIAYWFGGTDDHGTGRALIASTATPTTITEVQDTTGITGFGGEWTTESAQDYLYVVNFLTGTIAKYQLTVATPHDPLDGIWRLDEATPGAVLWRIIAEATAAGRPQQPLPDLTHVFTATLDSDGNAWAPHDGTLEYDTRVGEHLVDPVLRLVPYGLAVQMSPYLVLGGYNAYGRDLTGGAFGAGVVRFEAGVNIVGPLHRRLDERQAASHLEVEGAGNVFVDVTQDDLGYVREGYLGTELKDATAMTGTGQAELGRERDIADSLAGEVLWGDDEAAGLYLPGPPGSNGHYWVGDTARVHTGTGEVDLNEDDLRIYAITLEEQKNGDWKPTPEFISPFLLDPTAPGSSGTSGSGSSTSGSSSGSTGGSGSGASSTGKVNVRDDITGKTIAASTIAGRDHTVVETPAGTVVAGHRWPRLDQLEDVDPAERSDRSLPFWDAATATYRFGAVSDLALQGRPGRDGEDGEEGRPGPKGDPGAAGTPGAPGSSGTGGGGSSTSVVEEYDEGLVQSVVASFARPRGIRVRSLDGSTADGIEELVVDRASFSSNAATIRGALSGGTAAVQATKTADATITAQTAVTWDAADIYDSDGFHDPSVNPERLTVPAGMGGTYVGTFYVWVTGIAANTNYVHGRIWKGGLAGSTVAGVRVSRTSDDNTVFVVTTPPTVLAAGEYLVASIESDDPSFTFMHLGTSFSMVKLDSGRVGSGVGCTAVYGTGSLSATGSYVAVPFNGTDDTDTDNFHDTVTNNSRVTIPPGMGGLYLVVANYYNASNRAFFLNLFRNGSATNWYGEGIGAGDRIGSITAVMRLAAAEYVELRVNQSGGTEIASAFLSVMRLDSNASGVLASSKVSRTAGDLTTVSTTFVDMTSMTLDLTTGARRCLVTFIASAKNSGASNVIADLSIDGVRQGQAFGLTLMAGSDNSELGFSFLTDVLSAGTHTFKIVWRVDAGTGTVYASTGVAPAILAVQEQPDSGALASASSVAPAVQYSKAQSSSGIDRTTTAAAAVELDSTLRVTVYVPPSGQVLIRQAAQIEINITGVADANLAVQVDGAGAWSDTGGFAFNANDNASSRTVVGELLLTGLTPGPHTFYMGWYQAGGATLACHTGSRSGAVRGTWQSVTTVP